jgi:hypothetical protein
MSETTNTPYSKRCEILGQLWIQYSDEESLEDFFSYNDLGLSLSFAIDNEIVKSTPIAEGYINETFDLLLAALSMEDKGFDNLDELFSLN